MESAKTRGAARQQILDARSSDTKLSHKLIDKQHGKVNFSVSELHVRESTYNTSSGVLQGLREHFSKLATLNNTMKRDLAYKKPIQTEIPQIVDICMHISNSSTASQSVTV